MLDALDHFLMIYGQAALREIGGKAGISRQNSINTSAFRSGVLDLLQSKQELKVVVDDFDADDWALNTPGGIVDLKTGVVRPHDPAALCTKITAVTPMPRGKFEMLFPASRFARFLQEIFAKLGDDAERAELVEFEQASLGYCLTGDSSLHFLKFWYGEGRNGKSVFGEVIESLLGDYAKKISNQVLMSSRNERHPTEVANLMGARLVIASEISEGAYFNESQIKELTGDARLSARFMRQDFFEFRRTHKHLIYGNHKPRLRVADAAIKSRIKLTEFGMNFEASGRMDPHLKSKLMDEAPLVLAWFAEGARKLVTNGMLLPRSVVVERGTEEYMAENDVVRLWVEERCVVAESTTSGSPLRSKTLTLYEDYRAWRIARGEHPEAIQRFSQALHAHGFKSVLVKGAKLLTCIGLRDDRDDF